MKKTGDEFPEMMRQAIAVEKAGHRFYREKARETANPLAKATLLALAADESRHIKALVGFWRNEFRISGCPAVRVLFRNPSAAAREAILKKPVRAGRRLGPQAEAVRIYAIALQMETEGYNFYRKALGGARSAGEKKLLAFLIEEESSHYRLLAETKDYLEHPQEWFLKEEKSVIEG